MSPTLPERIAALGPSDRPRSRPSEGDRVVCCLREFARKRLPFHERTVRHNALYPRIEFDPPESEEDRALLRLRADLIAARLTGGRRSPPDPWSRRLRG